MACGGWSLPRAERRNRHHARSTTASIFSCAYRALPASRQTMATSERPENNIFVFGSNIAGRHGKGAALTARMQYGAQYGVGDGRTGNAYAIPTKNAQLQTLPLVIIRVFVDKFIGYAIEHPELTFQVTRVGCGLAGYKDLHMAPMFKNAPSNCVLPDAWRS